jgi:hypothetical protein
VPLDTYADLMDALSAPHLSQANSFLVKSSRRVDLPLLLPAEPAHLEVRTRIKGRMMNPSSTPPDPYDLLDMINDLKQLLQDQQDKIATMDLQRSNLEDQLIQATNEIDSLKRQPKSNVFSTPSKAMPLNFAAAAPFLQRSKPFASLTVNLSLLFQVQALACQQPPQPQLQLFLQLLIQL